MTPAARVLAALAVALFADLASADSPPLRPRPAEPDAVSLAAAVAGVERDAPKPEWSGYVPVLVGAAFERLWGALRPLRALFRLGAGAATTAAWAFVAAVALAVLAVLWRVFARRSLAPSPDRARTPTVAAGAAPSGAPPDWLAELDRRLEAGDVAGALEAWWWVFARRVAPGEARASWTSGELVARARRPELRPLAVQIDRFRYGPVRPAASDVRALARRVSAGTGAAGAGA